ncbi:DUF924 domain-containing protein [Aestuariivirga litoralis]|uniref:DUF924 domain-containing protein n=1 Tax=Aestuariivirga litoralis TaxID=2650924 RepID=A0A2W2APR6_9HYPH|nr:DUF924 family protein [Aestuariivirga litoralis]PZF77401.1 DUF924 domain-containing protein [Aestuariivirga litoralis]
MTPADVTCFWEQAGPTRWFFKDAAFDGVLKVRFGQALAAARNGAFDHWAETPEGALGLVILLDQVSRNIHRGSPLAFAADRQALRLAKKWVGQGFHQKLPAPRACWFVMPFEHAEDLDAQHRSVALFGTMGLHDQAHWAQIHLDIIARFGRFPHRNAVLGRVSTPEELDFLKAGGFAG